jgi:hypothetical protein
MCPSLNWNFTPLEPVAVLENYPRQSPRSPAAGRVWPRSQRADRSPCRPAGTDRRARGRMASTAEAERTITMAFAAARMPHCLRNVAERSHACIANGFRSASMTSWQATRFRGAPRHRREVPACHSSLSPGAVRALASRAPLMRPATAGRSHETISASAHLRVRGRGRRFHRRAPSIRSRAWRRCTRRGGSSGPKSRSTEPSVLTLSLSVELRAAL